MSTFGLVSAFLNVEYPHEVAVPTFVRLALAISAVLFVLVVAAWVFWPRKTEEPEVDEFADLADWGYIHIGEDPRYAELYLPAIKVSMIDWVLSSWLHHHNFVYITNRIFESGEKAEKVAIVLLQYDDALQVTPRGRVPFALVADVRKCMQAKNFSKLQVLDVDVKALEHMGLPLNYTKMAVKD